MFDKNSKKLNSDKFLALGLTGLVLFAQAPLSVIAQPVTSVTAPAHVAAKATVSTTSNEGGNDEEPSSTKDSKKPLLMSLQDKILYEYAEELGVPFEEFAEDALTFADMTAHIESNSKKGATNPYSGAMSYYQFLPSSVETAVVRLEMFMKKHDLGALPAWAKDIKANPEHIYSVSYENQTTLMLVNILNQKSSKKYFIAFAQGDNEAAKDIYYRYHHTAPDRATKVRTEQIFPKYFPQVFAMNI